MRLFDYYYYYYYYLNYERDEDVSNEEGNADSECEMINLSEGKNSSSSNLREYRTSTSEQTELFGRNKNNHDKNQN